MYKILFAVFSLNKFMKIKDVLNLLLTSITYDSWFNFQRYLYISGTYFKLDNRNFWVMSFTFMTIIFFIEKIIVLFDFPI